jgi:hypothetical protein
MPLHGSLAEGFAITDDSGPFGSMSASKGNANNNMPFMTNRGERSLET